MTSVARVDAVQGPIPSLPVPPRQRLLLAGGGHSHALLLRMWAMRPALRPAADGPRKVAVQAADEQGRVVARIDVDFAATFATLSAAAAAFNAVLSASRNPVAEDIALSATTIAENRPAGSIVATLSAGFGALEYTAVFLALSLVTSRALVVGAQVGRDAVKPA